MGGVDMVMSDPPHPGLGIRQNCLDPVGLNVTDAAKVLGVARHTLSRVLNGHAGISPEMALRLEKAGWSNAEFWLRRQTTYPKFTSHESKLLQQGGLRRQKSSSGTTSLRKPVRSVR